MTFTTLRQDGSQCATEVLYGQGTDEVEDAGHAVL